MCDNESAASQSEHESDVEQDSPTTSNTATAGASKRATSRHPTYLAMVMDAVTSQQGANGRGSGVSRAKIVQFIKSKYKLEDVNASALKNAMKKAIEKD